MKLKIYCLAFLAILCQLSYSQFIPNFYWISGAINMGNTNGDSVRFTPAQPNNYSLVESSIFQMPRRGQGVMGVKFRLRGGDGGTAVYHELVGGPWTANAGAGATITFTVSLDPGSFGAPFFVTYGKNGQSGNSNYTPCAGGGGGSTGMAWLIPGGSQLRYLTSAANLSLSGLTPAYLAIAAGGGGGEIINANISQSGNGGGVNTFNPDQSSLRTASNTCPPYSLEVIAGASTFDYSGNLDNLNSCEWNTISRSQTVFQYSTPNTNSILSGVAIGQGGGKPCNWTGGPPSNGAQSNASSFSLGCGGGTIGAGATAGGSGYSGGGAGSASLGTWVGAGGGGTATGRYGTAGYLYRDLASVTSVAAVGGENYVNPVYGGVINNGGNTNNPTSGYFEYQTIRDTIPPVLHLKDISVYLDGYGGYNLTQADIDNGSTDNDSIQDFIIYNAALTCSQIGQNTITVRLIDFAGNQTLGACYVTVIDTLHPVIPYSLTHPLYQLGTVQVGNITVDNYVTGIPVDISGGPVTVNQNYFQATTGGAIGGCNPDYPYTLSWPPTTFDCSQIGTYPNVPLTVTFATGRSTSAIISFYVYSSVTNLDVYVDSAATGGNNGTSWTDAYKNLQDALDYGCGQGRNIYIAKGTYYPDHGFDVALNNKSMSFTLRNGDQVYGGFPTHGDVFANRDPKLYPVVLSGNIGSGSSTADNTYQVLTIPAGASGTHIEGITISNSYNDLAISPNGGGVFITSTQPNNVPVADFVNCTFSNNYSTYGGAVGFIDTGAAGSANFENCSFLNNSCFYGGGAVNVNGGGETRTTAIFTNCVFQNNTANYGGGACISSSTAYFNNCSFGGNRGANDGGALYVQGPNQQIYVYNTVMYSDTSFSSTEIYESPAQVNIAYSDIQGSGGSTAWNSATGINYGHDIDADPMYIGGQHLQVLPSSPCRNGGSALYNNTALDISGTPRIVQDTIDIGAYETSPIVYVSWSAPNGGNGTSWATAYNKLQDGLNAALASGYTKDVWVKQGTYYPTASLATGTDQGRRNTFVVNYSQRVFGGFAGTETSFTQRNVPLNPTVLSGDLGVSGSNSDNAFHVITLNQVVKPRLDGLIIQDGNADSTVAAFQFGGGVDCSGSTGSSSPSPVFVNCVFRNNNASGGGGAVDCMASTNAFTMSFVQSIFYNNTTSDYGGALFINNTGGAGSNVKCNLYNCTATANSAGFDGGFAAGRCTLITGDTATLNLYNTIAWGDIGATGEFNNVRGISLQHAYNTILGFPNPHFLNAANIAGTDGLIMTNDDGLMLQPSSYGINGGSNAYLLTGAVNDSTYDITGANRVKQQTVDMGAYEQTGCLGYHTLYVDSSVAADGTGQSWATAFKTLSSALNIATMCSEVDSILIAQGTYYPGAKGIHVSQDSTFLITRKMTLLGGYPTGGGVRNVNVHPVILDANINGSLPTDNVYHIMSVVDGTTTDTITLDGLNFFNGFAEGLGYYNMAGHTFGRQSGAALLIMGPKLMVRNCTFYKNQAQGSGSSIQDYGGELTVINSVFYNNFTPGVGAAIRTEPGSSLTSIGCTYYNNLAVSNGAALSTNMGSNDIVVLFDNQFIKNQSTLGNGGTAVLDGGHSFVYNNTFYHSLSAHDGGALYFMPGTGTSTVSFYNNIFYRDTGTTNGRDIYNSSGATTLFQGNNSYSSTDPIFNNESNLIGADNIWGTNDDGLNLKNTSPLINQGDNSVANYPIDIAGNNRVQLGTVDIGAFESNSMITRWYVSEAQDSVVGDGTSWVTAFPQFMQGVSAAKPGDSVWVAEGTYAPDTGSSFSMKSNVQIYGGFNATETQLSQRNLAAGYNSFLQGTSGNIIINDSVNSAAVLDGFIVQNGTGPVGGGMRNSFSSPQVRNCVFANNSASLFGGAVTCSNSSPVFTNIIFYNNSVTGPTSLGGAFYCANNSYPLIHNCDFVNNHSTFNSGAVYCLSNAHIAISNSAFTGNTAANLYDDNFFAGSSHLSHNLLQTGPTGLGNIISADAGMLDQTNGAGPDGLWFTADDGLQLAYTTNLINRGINDSVFTATDIIGAARIRNGTVDIGAYESPDYNYCDSASFNSIHVLYVDGNRPANGNGYSWQTAFITLGEALDRANNCSSFDTILVAAGKYYPTGYQGDTNRNLSFTILRSGFAVLGGYPQGGGVRNTGASNTVLSGDIGIASDNSDNSYHVLVFKNVDNTGSVDGFIIRDGAANSPNGDANGNGGGAWIDGSGSGGYCRPKVSNCVFTANYAYYGGAIINDATNGGNSSPTFINCVFAKNICDQGLGGAMYNVASYSGVSMPVITNCTIAENSSSGYGGGIYDDCSLSGTVTTTLKNTILWGNTSNQGLADQQFTGNGCTSTASYCIVQGGLSGSLADGGHNLYVNPRFSDSATLTGTGDSWMTSADGLKIYNSSPAINAGNALGAPGTDITGALHVGLPDIGAYENFCGGTVFVTQNVVACDSALAPSYRYWRTTGGTFNDTTLTSTGCDTIFTVHLTLGHSTFDSITASACRTYTSPAGHVWDSTGVYTDVLTNATGCDSVIKVNLTIYQGSASVISAASCGSYTSPSGKVWIITGAYNDTIPNSHGCDSIITINLTVHSASASTINAGICTGQSYLFNSVALTSSGTYLDTLQNVNGCDSLITLHLTVSNVLTGSFSHAICPGGSYLFNGQQLTQAGNYLDTLQTSGGCDSIVTLHLTINPVLTGSFNSAICTGGSYSFNGQQLTQAGTYLDTLQGSTGCDSIVTLHLTVANVLTGSFNQAICAGDSYLFNGQQLTQAGSYADTLQSAGGCDSIVTLHLTINPVLTGSFNAAICTGSSYTFNGQQLTQSGTYLDTLQGSTGCDSIVTLHLTVSNVLTGSVSHAICAGDSYLFNGQQLTQAGSYADTLQSSGGCDSIVTLTLTVNAVPGNTITVNGGTSFCTGDSVELTAPAGNTYLWSTAEIVQSIFAKTTGSYIVTVTNGNNCSAVATPLSITANPLPAVPVITRVSDTLTSTSAQAYQWYLNNNLLNGATGQKLVISQNGDYLVEVSDSNGCSNRSAVFNVLNMGIGNIAAGYGVVLYPNPNSGLFTIEFSNDEQKEIEITNTIGEVVLRVMSTEKLVSINLAHVASGIYFAQVKQNSQLRTIRFSLLK